MEEKIIQASYVAVRVKGGMNDTLFRDYIRKVIVPKKMGRLLKVQLFSKLTADLEDSRTILYMLVF